MKTVEELASTLRYLVEGGYVPGLLPYDVLEAAGVLVAQKAEIESLSAALATKQHTVTASAKKSNAFYKTDLKIELVAADPRRYFSEMQIDNVAMIDGDYLPYAARHMTRVATADWLNEIEVKCAVELHKVLKKLSAEKAPK